METGIVYAPYVLAQCVDKDGRWLNGQVQVESRYAEQKCRWDEERGCFVFVVPDEDLDKFKTSVECAPNKEIKDRYSKVSDNTGYYLKFKV